MPDVGVDQLVERVLTRCASGNVTVKVDVPATIQARKRWPSFEGLLVGSFDSPIGLYRVFDGEEMAHILQSGRITGGKYSVPAERSMGASWGHDISAAIRFGNNARGKRLGQKIYLAKIDALDKQFLHLGPEGLSLDLTQEDQTVSIPKTTCNLGLGCSVADVSVHDVDDFYEVLPNDQIERVNLSELKANTRLASVARVISKYAAYFNTGDIVLLGKYKNKKGRIVGFGVDKWGNPTVEVEPIPKGRKQNKIFGLYKIWRADVKENALKKQQAEQAALEGERP